MGLQELMIADRAQDSADPMLGAQQIGVNVVMSGPPTWYSFADVIASKILNATAARKFCVPSRLSRTACKAS